MGAQITEKTYKFNELHIIFYYDYLRFLKKKALRRKMFFHTFYRVVA